MLFAYGRVMSHRELRHSFIGGAVEDGESPAQAVLRELAEEARVRGEIVFPFSTELHPDHRTFLVDIGGQECRLGHDPEESSLPQDDRSLMALVWIDLAKTHLFTEIDREYIAQLYTECLQRGHFADWLPSLRAFLTQTAS